MRTRAFVNPMIAASVILMASPPNAWAVPFPLQDPGFDVFVAGTLTPIGDDRFAGYAGGPQSNIPLLVGSTAGPTGEFGDVPAGWVAFGGSTARFRNDIEFLAPTGTMALAGTADPTVFAQNLGMPAVGNATYVATIDVSDRNSAPIAGGTDVTFVAPNVSLQLITDIGPNQTDLGGILTFTPPPNGGTSTMTLTVTTGADVPAGNLSFVFSCFGSGGANTHTLFDNATLDAPATENADFDGDDDVDGEDFLIWQRGLGLDMQGDNSNGDADGSSVVDGADLDVWTMQFDGGSLVATISAIPEPASCLLSLTAISIGVLALKNGGRGAGRAHPCH